MNGMKERLVEKAIALVRVRGYSAFSYADLAQAVGIRKPSIHHHFPAKEDLGEAIVEAYSAEFFGRLDAIAASDKGRADKIAAYAGLYREALAAGQACLCGMLASEVSVLPARVRASVTRFFERNVGWLEAVLSSGRARGPRGGGAKAGARQRATMILGALQGALFVARSLGSPRVFEDAVRGIAREFGHGRA